MRLHRPIRAARGLAAAAWILLALAGPAPAMPADNVRPGAAQRTTATPTVVRETLIRPDDGPGTLATVAIAGGAAAALLGAGYLGAYLASRGARARVG